jgi:hypothetical protein
MAMREILTSRQLQDKLSQEGFLQSQKFDWQKAAGSFLGMLEKMV